MVARVGGHGPFLFCAVYPLVVMCLRVTISYRSDKHKRRACEKLIARGWTFEEGPICPECGKQQTMQPDQ